MSHYVVIDSCQNLYILTKEEIEEALARGVRQLYQGSEKQCKKYYDDIAEEWGYTGPIWDIIEMNN